MYGLILPDWNTSIASAMNQWNPDFLAATHSIKNIDRDFIEWHKGRTRYAIWALHVDDKCWLQHLHLAREMLMSCLLSGKQRMPHITLFAVGFVEDTGFSDMVSQQKNILKKCQLKPFELQLGRLDSFSSAAYFSVVDLASNLNKIRNAFSSVMQEERNVTYTPHLTVGLYNAEYPTASLIELMKDYENPVCPSIEINKMSLMCFDTKSIFSPLEVMDVFEF